jgi:hypothetical protein
VRAGQSASALPPKSDINLFCYREGVVDLDADVSDRALDLRNDSAKQRMLRVAEEYDRLAECAVDRVRSDEDLTRTLKELGASPTVTPDE